MSTHAGANAPDFFYGHGLEQLVAPRGVTDIHDTSGLLLPTLGGVIGELGQCLGRGDTNANRDAGLLSDFCLYLATYRLQRFGQPGHIGKGFVDAIDLDAREAAFQDRHHTLAHVAIEGVVAAEGDDAVALEVASDLVEQGAHFHERLGIGRTGNHAAVVVAEYYDGRAQQVRAKHALATGVEAVAVDQCVYRLSHG
nr:hypothetical protein [Pseudomonas alcaligenes]